MIISSHLLAMVEDICSHVLVLDAGRQRFCGTITQLQATVADARDDVSLEDMFFRAIEPTHGTAVPDTGWTSPDTTVQDTDSPVLL